MTPIIPLYLFLNACVTRVTLTRRVDTRSLRLMEEAIQELRTALDMAQLAVDEEKVKRRKRPID